MNKFLYSYIIFSVFYTILLHANMEISLGEFKSYKSVKKIVKKYPNSKVTMIENSLGETLYKVTIDPNERFNHKKKYKKRKDKIDIHKEIKVKKDEFEHINDELIIYDDSIKYSDIPKSSEQNSKIEEEMIQNDNSNQKLENTPVPFEEIIDIDKNTTATTSKKSSKVENENIENQEIKTYKNSAGISLHEAILIALKKSNKIMAAREKVIQAKRVVDEKYSGFKPKIDFMANANKIEVTPKDENSTIYNKNDYTLTFKQNIYNGGKDIGELKREKANLKVAQSKFKQKVEEETTKIIDAYYSLIYQTKSIEATKKNMELLEKILNIVKIKEKNGAATKGDLNYIKSQIENASSELIKQKSLYQNALSMYEYFVGKGSSLLPKETKIKYKKFNKKELLNILNKYNSQIEVAKAKIEVERYNLESLKSKFKPILDFTIRNRGKFTNSDVEPGEKRTTGFLTINYNLYNGGKDKARILGSKSKVLELKYKLVDLEDSMKFNLKQIYETTISSQDSMIHTKKEVEANKKVVDSYWSAFKYGNQDIQALMLAQRALNRSELDLIKERQKYTSNYFNLLKVSGILLKELNLDEFIDPSKMIQNDSINYLY